MWWAGKRTGQGTMLYNKGEKYVGEWEDNRRHGQGVYTYADQSSYNGAWLNDLKQGQGVMHWKERGLKWVGLWEKGDKKEGMMTDMYGKEVDDDGN